MAQILTVASILALVGLLGWRYADRLFERRQHAAGSAGPRAIAPPQFERRVHRASAREFLHGAADLTFGILILGLGFFMLMWIIATG
ncbi:MAG: hypothetical protein JWL71_3507 [Acidobacteria bacterium]|jgi:hypothetical protein|nr:hypothetical protein [Acidobacteriota bacterium]